MDAGRFDQLTDGQRDCLRLVLSHHNSKEIAAIHGVSPSAIDKRIERAVQILQVSTRFEAARRLDEHERMTAAVSGSVAQPPLPARNATEPDMTVAYERLPSEPFDVASPPPPTPGIDAFEPWGLVRRFLGTAQTSGLEGAARNRLSKGDRLVRLIGITGLIAITTMALLTMATTLNNLIRTNRATAPAYGTAKAVPAGGRILVLKERRHAADTVAADFLKAEIAVDQAAQYAASCVATILQQRAAANLPVGTAAAALQLVSEAASDIIKARQRFIDAHSALVAVRGEIGLGQFYGYGDGSECPPSEGALRSELPVRLAAVA